MGALLTFTRSMQASILSCSTVLRACEMLAVLLLDMPSFFPRPWRPWNGRERGQRAQALLPKGEAGPAQCPSRPFPSCPPPAAGCCGKDILIFWCIKAANFPFLVHKQQPNNPSPGVVRLFLPA